MLSPVARGTSNLLLDAIEAESGGGFLANARGVELARGSALWNAAERVRHVYFPLDCVLSTLAVLSDGSSLELSIIGREGAVGVLGALGSTESTARVAVLVGGLAARVPMRHVRNEFERGSSRARNVIIRHVENQLFQTQQSAVCAARHSIEARLCRWLLTIRDRTPENSLQATHEFLAEHLGANRTSVTLAAAALQRAGLITYRRGIVSITNRDGLEETTCECYGAIRDRMRRMHR
jgi:CRP-like cAMP-binding protein